VTRRILASYLVAALVAPTSVLADESPPPDPEEAVPDAAPEPAPETTPDAEPAPAPEAPAVKLTIVSGRITDASTKEGMPAATIQLKNAAGEQQTFVTELDGTYKLELAPGTYTIEFSTMEYDLARKTITVADQALELSLALTPATVAGKEEVIEVSSTIDTRKESAVLAVRQAATTVSDAVSSQEIARTPDSNAGDAMKRVVAVSVTDGKYVALRGLEGRYVTSLLNGVLLPSPEPDRNAVPLDLFPTSLLQTMTVYKSYSAELPGQFGGGVLQIDTSSFPQTFEMKFGVSTAANTVATGQTGLTNAHATGLSNFLGYDDGSRRLPSSVPKNRAVRGMDPIEQESIGESFANVWTPTGETVTPNVGLTATVGNTTKLFGKKVGYLATGMMKRNYSVRQGANSRNALAGGELQSVESLNYDIGVAEGTVGALANAGIELDDDNRITALGLYSHVGENTSQLATGYSEVDGTDIDVSRLMFITRSLSFGQLNGKHRLSRAHGVDLTWQANVANTTRNELDSRDLVYTIDNATSTKRYKDQPGSGQHFFQQLADMGGGVGADLTAKAGDFARFRAGTMLQASRRELAGRRFRFRYVGDDTTVRGLAGEEMFAPNHIGPDFILEEGTLNEDAYTAKQDVYAGYATTELSITPELRAIVGARYERAAQAMDNGSRYAIAGLETSISRTEDDILPAANLAYALTPTQNLRAAYSYTLARPKFRELAPFLFYDYIRRREISGNPNLLTTHLHNADLRWEWFPNEGEVIAASAFYKHFVDPIEQVLSNSNSDATFRNAQGGNLAGGEIEARKAIGKFRFAGNFAVMRSRVQLSSDEMLLTSKNRPLFGQSPFVVNASIGYVDPKLADINLLYNVVGARIVDVGIEGLPDTYEQPVHRVDLVAARMIANDLRLKLGVSNLLNQSVRITQGALTTNAYDPGVSITLGLDWTP